MSRKRNVARAPLCPMWCSTGNISQLHTALRKEKTEASGDILDTSIRTMIERNVETYGTKMEDGSYHIN
ncbi:hypothetical protein HVZ23_01070 [Citrobacter freundii]|uniref:hypothetical protein n=1 Tax=Citrobacter freundii TaxID=546 RepID=UPI0015FD653E|nr:hypothetical protein [Citrobacter freundii]